jgi:hypothetical protein
MVIAADSGAFDFFTHKTGFVVWDGEAWRNRERASEDGCQE